MDMDFHSAAVATNHYIQVNSVLPPPWEHVPTETITIGDPVEIYPGSTWINPNLKTSCGTWWDASVWTVPISPWRVDLTKHDRIALSIDVPGVKADGLNLSIQAGNVYLSGKRFDNGGPVSHSYLLGHDYDPHTAEASLDSGVLTLTIMKLRDKTPHVVKVSVR